jgi:hypothetical protein
MIRQDMMREEKESAEVEIDKEGRGREGMRRERE